MVTIKSNWDFKAKAADDFRLITSVCLCLMLPTAFIPVPVMLIWSAGHWPRKPILPLQRKPETILPVLFSHLSRLRSEIPFRFSLQAVKADQCPEVTGSFCTSSLREKPELQHSNSSQPMWMQLDSTQFNTWIPCLLEQGRGIWISENRRSGLCGISQDNTNSDYLLRRNRDWRSEPITRKPSRNSNRSHLWWYLQANQRQWLRRENVTWWFHLNLNDHGNKIDGVDMKTALSSMEQNYPNPFSRSTEINYELADGSDVMFEVMDLTGR